MGARRDLQCLSRPAFDDYDLPLFLIKCVFEVFFFFPSRRLKVKCSGSSVAGSTIDSTRLSTGKNLVIAGLDCAVVINFASGLSPSASA